MNCLHSHSARTTPLLLTTDIVFQVLYRVRYKPSYRDIAELFCYAALRLRLETVRDCGMRFSPNFTDELMVKRKEKMGNVWHVDET